MNNKAIVSIIIGKRYISFWQKYGRKSWEIYAKKYGYDLVIIEEVLDKSERAQSRSIAWQKCLILSHPLVTKYEQIVWLDSDIIINNERAPDITCNVDLKSIAGVNQWSIPDLESHPIFVRRSQNFHSIDDASANYNNEKEYYTFYGFDKGFDKVLQTGVFVASPAHHKDLFRYVYDEYEGKPNEYNHYEMRPLSYETLKQETNIIWLSSKFNYLTAASMFIYYPAILKYRSSLIGKVIKKLSYLDPAIDQPVYHALNTLYSNCYFLHFAGQQMDMRYVTRCLDYFDKKVN